MSGGGRDALLAVLFYLAMLCSVASGCSGWLACGLLIPSVVFGLAAVEAIAPTVTVYSDNNQEET